jgi:hypothetical protein
VRAVSSETMRECGDTYGSGLVPNQDAVDVLGRLLGAAEEDGLSLWRASGQECACMKLSYLGVLVLQGGLAERAGLLLDDEFALRQAIGALVVCPKAV